MRSLRTISLVVTVIIAVGAAHADTCEREGMQRLKAPDLSGLQLIDPGVNSWQGQVIYLDFDGAQDVVYNGPVVVEGVNISEFSAEPAGLAGHESKIISQVLSSLEQTFGGTGVLFTVTRPDSATLCSTIFVGGDDSAFSAYGSFAGLAEKVDVGNQDPDENAFVFSDNVVGGCTDLGSLATRLESLIAHEVGHLLGYAHNHESSFEGPLAPVALFESNGTATLEITSIPTTVGPGQLVDITVRYKLSGNTKSGPWDVDNLSINEVDSSTFTTVEQLWDWQIVDTILQQNQWYYHTFQNVDLNAHDILEGHVLEISAHIKIDDNTFGTVDPRATTPIHAVTMVEPDLIGSPADISTDVACPGMTLTLDVTVKNQGGWQASAGHIYYYWSPLVPLPISAYRVGSDWYGSLNANETSSKSFSYTVPCGTKKGIYYLSYRIDALGTTNERDDLNNNIGGFRVDVRDDDFLGPSAPSPDLVYSSDTGRFDFDNITADNTPEFKWNPPSDQCSGYITGYRYRVGNTPDHFATQPPITYYHTSLSNGEHIFYVRARDNSGNWGDTGSLPFYVDRSRPSTDSVDLRDSSDSGYSNTDNYTNDNTPTFDFSASDNSDGVRFGVYRLGVYRYRFEFDHGPPFYSTTSSSWTPTPPQHNPLPDGVTTLYVKAEDYAGNVSNIAASLVVTIDTTAPAVVLDDLQTYDSTPELTGTVDDPDADIEVTVSGITYTATNNQDQTWTLADDTISPALVPGTYDVAVSATDRAGNVGTDTATLTVTPTVIDVNIDINPNRVPNRVYLSRNYTIYVAVLGSVDFDVTNIDSSSVTFGRTGTEASPVRAPIMRDLNGDGFVDAMYGFQTFDCGFQLGDTEGWLTGFTTDNKVVDGSDSVLVSP
ncbi:MAG: Ig-like domain-containing protein [Planctomycetota bacterium]